MGRIIAYLFLLISFCFLICSCCSVPHPKHYNDVELASLTTNESVALVFTEDQQTHIICAGVFISKNFILTAAHCVVGVQELINEEHAINAIFGNGDNPEDFQMVGLGDFPVNFILKSESTGIGLSPKVIHSSILYSISQKNDLALLEVVDEASVPYHKIAKIADDLPKIGEHLGFMGHQKGLEWTYVEGNVAAYRKSLPMDDILPPFLQVSAPVTNGSSGGGAWNDRGELVGIASFVHKEAPNMAFYIPITTINGWLAALHFRPLKINPNISDEEVSE